jgi:hypothetical protein
MRRLQTWDNLSHNTCFFNQMGKELHRKSCHFIKHLMCKKKKYCMSMIYPKIKLWRKQHGCSVNNQTFEKEGPKKCRLQMSAKNEKQNKNRGWRSGKKGKGGERKKETHLIAGEWESKDVCLPGRRRVGESARSWRRSASSRRGVASGSAAEQRDAVIRNQWCRDGEWNGERDEMIHWFRLETTRSRDSWVRDRVSVKREVRLWICDFR